MASQRSEQTNRAVVSVLGSDRPGIVAAVSTVLAQADANILDISQTILQGIFTMTMLVDLSAGESDFADLQSRLVELQEQLGVQIMLQREDVFRYMYRL
ncbi:ACT domain-containing protein [uncultured Olegusella sp.]|uniref:ACT domain-containing protein n=1 Tax=uncultured Olegusella sp. TaxID=1979846 RepID=UPI00261F8944|nr:ACT domain-containing protein [uncultured Olegusella sp.]